MSTPNGALNSPNNDCCDSRSSDKPAIDSLNSEKVAILSCSGSQHSPKLIDRKVRELEVETQILPLNTSAKELLKEQYKAIIIAGGPGSVFAEDSLPYDKDIFTIGIPVLGIGYGFQMINNHFGGSVGECKEEHKDSAQLTITVDSQNPLFSNLDSQQKVLQATGVTVSKVADGFEVVGKSENVIFAIANVEKKLYGVQFYPENDLATNGKEMLKNFLFNVASLSGNFTLKSRVDKSIDRIQKLVGPSKVLVLVNGGVNSVVSATLLVKALKANQVIALYIDSGFMRKNESVQVEKALKNVGLDMKTIKAWLQFSNASTVISLSKEEPNKKVLTKMLCQTVVSEEKRHIIVDTFVRILNNIVYDYIKLNHGQKVFFSTSNFIETLDLVESTENEDASKTHRQLETKLVNNLLFNFGLPFVEPLKDFYEDEMLLLGRYLDVPLQFLNLHPFPVPGLAVRIICAEQPYKKEDFSFTASLLKVVLNYTILQKEKHSVLSAVVNARASTEDLAFLETFSATYKFTPTLLPIKSVQGNFHVGYVVGLSESSENQPPEPTITAKFEALARLAKLIATVCPNVSRVCYIFGSSVKCPVEDITPTTLTPKVVELLREADDIATEELKKAAYDYESVLSAMSLIFIPIHFDREPALLARYPSCRHSVVISTFIATDDDRFTAGGPAFPNQPIPFQFLRETAEKICQLPGISRVLLDLTSTPPATTEWE